MSPVRRLAAGPAAVLVLAAAGLFTAVASPAAQAATAVVPWSGDRIEVTLTAQETRLAAVGQGVGAYICSSYVARAAAYTTFEVPSPATCAYVVDLCATTAQAVGARAVVVFMPDRVLCGRADFDARSTP
jgi:hypothetical protein